MPYADKSSNDRCKREWDRKHKERIAARKKKKYWERVDVTRANRNERNSRSHYAKSNIYEGLPVLTIHAMTNPRFKVVGDNGKVRFEQWAKLQEF